jgi:predicted DNA-binding protein with PD1-like motif
VNEQAEVASLVGDIGLVDGKPAVHIRAVVVPKDGIARGGHLLQAVAGDRLAHARSLSDGLPGAAD